MGLFKRSKRSSGGTFSVSYRNAYLLALLALGLAHSALAETGEVSAIGNGRDVGEATLSLLRNSVTKYFTDEPAAITRPILQNEIIPNASSFVQSYKMLEGSKGGAVSISANVDLDVLRALFSLRPDRMGEEKGAKALVVVRGARIPEAMGGAAPANPYLALEQAAKERFSRRQFEPLVLGANELQEMGIGDDVTSPELLRGLGAKKEARLVLGVASHYESFENENAHGKDERLLLTATLVDVKAGTVIGRSSIHVTNPKTRRDIYVSDLQKVLLEESKDLFQDVIVSAGKRLAKEGTKEEFALVRVQYPPNALLVSRFRTALEAVKGVKSVVEFSAHRGAYDFALRPALAEAALVKSLQSQELPEMAITILQTTDAVVEEGPRPVLLVRLSPKADPAAAPKAEGGENAVP